MLKNRQKDGQTQNIEYINKCKYNKSFIKNLVRGWGFGQGALSVWLPAGTGRHRWPNCSGSPREPGNLNYYVSCVILTLQNFARPQVGAVSFAQSLRHRSHRCFFFIKGTICPKSSDPFYIVTYYIKWVTTSWTDSINQNCTCLQTIPQAGANDTPIKYERCHKSCKKC